MAIRCKVERKRGETCCDRDTSELGAKKKLAAEGSGIVDVDSVWPNNFQVSVAFVPHLEKVYWNLRQKIGRT